MKKEEQVTETKIVTKTFRYCDDCGEQISPTQGYYGSKCIMCDKDLCNKCTAKEEYTGDYTDVYCKKCVDITNEYKDMIDGLQEQIDKLEDECAKKCVEERNKI